MNHKRSIFSLLLPKGKGQVVDLWRMSALVIGLSALVLVTFAAYAPDVAAADIALLATESKLVGTHCSDAVAEKELDRDYGTFSGCWTDDDVAAANSELVIARRYTAAGQTDAQAALLAANPELMVARHYVAAAAKK